MSDILKSLDRVTHNLAVRLEDRQACEEAAAEILRLRSSVTAMRERAAQVAENYKAADLECLIQQIHIAAAIRALPITEDGE